MTLLLPPPTLHALPHQRPCPFTAPPHDLNLTENATALQSRPFLLSPARFSEDDCHDDDDESEVEDICHPSPGSDTYDGHVSEATSTANHSINNMEFPGARKNDGEASAVGAPLPESTILIHERRDPQLFLLPEADEGPNSGEISGLSLMENRDDDSDIYCTPSPPPMPMQSRINVHSLAVKQEDASEEDVSDILGPPEAGSSRHGSAGTPDAVSTPITWKLDTAEEVRRFGRFPPLPKDPDDANSRQPTAPLVGANLTESTSEFSLETPKDAIGEQYSLPHAEYLPRKRSNLRVCVEIVRPRKKTKVEPSEVIVIDSDSETDPMVEERSNSIAIGHSSPRRRKSIKRLKRMPSKLPRKKNTAVEEKSRKRSLPARTSSTFPAVSKSLVDSLDDLPLSAVEPEAGNSRPRKRTRRQAPRQLSMSKVINLTSDREQSPEDISDSEYIPNDEESESEDSEVEVLVEPRPFPMSLTPPPLSAASESPKQVNRSLPVQRNEASPRRFISAHKASFWNVIDYQV